MLSLHARNTVWRDVHIPAPVSNAQSPWCISPERESIPSWLPSGNADEVAYEFIVTLRLVSFGVYSFTTRARKATTLNMPLPKKCVRYFTYICV